ncbi:FUSC family protein [Clostridium sp.]|uniref:FUSC family protein n=1 Tax=Clostridium sp. TaxID=1506 RepID=UPI003F67495C
MIAVSIVVIALTLVTIDLKEDILRKTTLISIVIVILGIGASIAFVNPLIGLAVNMIILFGIITQTIDNYKAPMYFPFVLSYIFMLMSSPATYEQLPLRVISIVVGSIYVLLVQLVLNKDRFEKTISGTRKGMIFNLTTQINNILDGKYNKDINYQIKGLVNTTVKAIYDNKSKKKYITEKNIGNLQVALLLNSLNNDLEAFNYSNNVSDDERKLLIKVKEIVQLVDDYFSTVINKNMIILKIDIAISDISDKDNIKKTLYNITEYLKLTERHTDKSNWKKELIIKNAFKKIDINSVSFKFAFKMSVSVSIIIFLTSILNITYGRWIVLPMIAIIQPYYDLTLVKAKNRIVGTIFGIILFTIIFTIIKEPSVRMNITILVAYIGLFLTKYQYSTSMVAISALGASAMNGGGIEIIVYRILFTVVGCTIAMVVNKYILHYKVSDSIQDLTDEYKTQIKKLNSIKKTKDNETKIYNIILNTKLMEYKLYSEIEV